MRSKFAREIALLTLPVLLIGGVALWKGKLKGWSGFGATPKPPVIRPRLELTDWHRATPSALDFARGLSSRWTVNMHMSNSCATVMGLMHPNGMRPQEKLFFAWKRGGKWRQIFIPYVQMETEVHRFIPRRVPPYFVLKLGLPLDLVPHDAEEVRLRGQLEDWNQCQGSGDYVSSKPLDIPLKKAREFWPKFSGSRSPVVKMQSTKQEWNPVVFYSGTHDLKVHGVFAYSGRVKNGSLRQSRSWLVDGKGNFKGELQPGRWKVVQLQKGVARGTWLLVTRQLELKNGPYTLKSWVYVDKNEWPLQVSIPLNIDKRPTRPKRVRY